MTQPIKKPRFPANPDAPKFTPELWKRKTGDSVMANCIAYAYSGSNPDGRNAVVDEAAPQLGYTAGYLAVTPEMLSEKELPELMQKEGLVWVGKKAAKSEPNRFEVPPVKPGYYVVGLYLVKTPEGNISDTGGAVYDYHFVRQDADGGWSEKMAGAHVSRAFEPAKDGGYQALPNDHLEGYRFAGYGYVPKHGIDAGIEPRLIPSILYGLARGYDICEGLSEHIGYFRSHPEQPWGLNQLHNISETLKRYNIPEAREAYEICIAPHVQSIRQPKTIQEAPARP